MTPADWFLLGAPWDCSGSGRGEQAAPDALRAAGLGAAVGSDLGNVALAINSTERDQRTGVLALEDTLRAARALAEALEQALRDWPNKRPLVVGGDCSILLGIVPALLRQVGAVGLWFLNGHPDYLDGMTSETGETADMDLAVLTGNGAESLTTLAGEVPMIPWSDVVLIGHRGADLDRAAAAELARVPSALRRIDAATVGSDPGGSARRAASWLSESGHRAWLHLDLDVLDPRCLPAVTYPQPDGLDWDQLAEMLAHLAHSPRLLGISVADFRPDLDAAGDLARRLIGFLQRALP